MILKMQLRNIFYFCHKYHQENKSTLNINVKINTIKFMYWGLKYNTTSLTTS